MIREFNQTFRGRFLLSIAIFVIALALGIVLSVPAYHYHLQVINIVGMGGGRASSTIAYAWKLFSHNFVASLVTLIMCLVAGYRFSIMVLVANGLLGGYLSGVLIQRGVGVAMFLAGLAPHGVVELLTMFLVSAVTLRFRGVYYHRSAMQLRCETASAIRILPVVFCGVLIAAFLEAWVTPWVVEALRR